jgi:hypothetical protein
MLKSALKASPRNLMASNNASFSVVFRDQFLIETE